MEAPSAFLTLTRWGPRLHAWDRRADDARAFSYLPPQNRANTPSQLQWRQRDYSLVGDLRGVVLWSQRKRAGGGGGGGGWGLSRPLNSFLRYDGCGLTIGILLRRNVFIAAAAGLADWVSTSSITKYVPYASGQVADTTIDMVGRLHHLLVQKFGQPADEFFPTSPLDPLPFGPP
jgi:hypothetical protein